MADLQKLLSDGEIVEIFLGDITEEEKVLVKKEIEALIESLQVSLGNYTFDGSNQLLGGKIIFTNAPTSRLGINNDNQFENLSLSSPGQTSLAGDFLLLYGTSGISAPLLTIAIIDDSSYQSIITKGWTLAKFFAQTDFINKYSGNAGEPLVTSQSGKIDSSLLPTQSAPQGNFTPTAGTEYPDITGKVAGDYWVVENVGAGYLFTGGDLAGKTVYESAWMQLDINLEWLLSSNYQGAQQTSWGSIIGEWADQTDNANAVNAKADQTDLDTTNTNVSTNASAISTLGSSKADQADLDTTNTNVSANATAIGEKADQTDLDATNEVVAQKLSDVTAGANVTIDKTNPINPIISASGGGGDSSFISPEDYGAVGNGIADDYNALVSFFNALQSGATGLMGHNKTYRTSQYMTFYLSGDIMFDGNGSSVVMDFADIAGGSGYILYFRTLSNVSKNLTVNALKGAVSITVSDTTNVESGMGLWLRNGYWTDLNSAINKQAMAIVTKIEGNVVYFDCPLPTNFDVLFSDTEGGTADVQCVVEFSNVRKIEISNFECSAIGTPEIAAHNCLRIDRSFYTRITNYKASYAGRNALGLYQVYGAVIDSCSNDKAELTTYGLYYNVLINSVIRACTFKAITPAIVSDAGCSYSNVFDSCYLWSLDTFAFDSHGTLSGTLINSKLNSVIIESGDWTIFNCEIHECTSETERSIIGFRAGNDEIRTRVKIDNCTFIPSLDEPKNNFIRLSTVTQGAFYLDKIKISNCSLYSEEWLFDDKAYYDFENNWVYPNNQDRPYMLADTNYEKQGYLNKPFYKSFKTPAITTLDLGEIDSTGGWSIIGNVQLSGVNEDQTIWGSVNKYLQITVNSNNRFYARFRLLDGTYPNDGVQPNGFQSGIVTVDIDSVWRNYAVTMTPNGDNLTGTLRFYVNGRIFYKYDTAGWTSFYTGLANPFAFGGDNGAPVNIQNTLFFNRGLSTSEVNYYAIDMDRGYQSDAVGKWLEERTRNTWVDESGNGYDAVINQAVIPTTDIVSRNAAKYIPYDNTSSGTTAENVQTTLDELEARP